MTVSLRIELFPAELERAVAFYTGGLGFTVEKDDRATGTPYVAVHRDGVRIGLLGSPGTVGDRLPPFGVEIVLEVDDILAERERIVAAGIPLLDDLQRRAWGLTDFRFLDPDGYFLRFTERANAHA